MGWMDALVAKYEYERSLTRAAKDFSALLLNIFSGVERINRSLSICFHLIFFRPQKTVQTSIAICSKRVKSFTYHFEIKKII